MKKFLLISLLCLPLVKSQDVTSIASLINLIRKPPVQAFSITDSSDSSVCTANKIAGTTINYTINCSGSAGSQTYSNILTFAYNNIICLGFNNTTITPIPANGSWPIIPPTSVVFQCAVTVSTTPIFKTISWP